MARLNPRRRASKAGKAAIIAANFLSNTPRSKARDISASRVDDGTKLANATATPPQGAAFTARVVDRPVLKPRTHKFRGTKADLGFKGSSPYRLVLMPDKFVRVPICPITGQDRIKFPG
jgi:hypothetical protein